MFDMFCICHINKRALDFPFGWLGICVSHVIRRDQACEITLRKSPPFPFITMPSKKAMKAAAPAPALKGMKAMKKDKKAASPAPPMKAMKTMKGGKARPLFVCQIPGIILKSLRTSDDSWTKNKKHACQ